MVPSLLQAYSKLQNWEAIIDLDCFSELKKCKEVLVIFFPEDSN